MERLEAVDAFIAKHENFEALLQSLREQILEHPFEETLKWGMPTYVYNKRNLVGLGAFKKHCSLWFFQGALLKDEAGVLSNAQEGKTKAMRHMKFKSAEELDVKLIDHYLKETIENEQEGRFVAIERKVTKLSIPNELQQALSADSSLNDKFEALTPGRKKEYAEHIASAKRIETKLSRLEKIKPLILAGKGLNDKYKNC